MIMSKLYIMMSASPPNSKDNDELCPMCHRLKSKHTPEEMLACSRKLQEFNKNSKGGAGLV